MAPGPRHLVLRDLPPRALRGRARAVPSRAMPTSSTPTTRRLGARTSPAANAACSSRPGISGDRCRTDAHVDEPPWPRLLARPARPGNGRAWSTLGLASRAAAPGAAPHGHQARALRTTPACRRTYRFHTEPGRLGTRAPTAGWLDHDGASSVAIGLRRSTRSPSYIRAAPTRPTTSCGRSRLADRTGRPVVSGSPSSRTDGYRRARSSGCPTAGTAVQRRALGRRRSTGSTIRSERTDGCNSRWAGCTRSIQTNQSATSATTRPTPSPRGRGTPSHRGRNGRRSSTG